MSNYSFEQFQDVVLENEWQETRVLLQMRASLQGSAKIDGRGTATETISTSLLTKDRVSVQQARTRVLSLNRDPQGTLSDFRLEIKYLVKLAHPSLRIMERELLAID